MKVRVELGGGWTSSARSSLIGRYPTMKQRYWTLCGGQDDDLGF